MNKRDVVVFGDRVLLEQREKKVGVIHLPKSHAKDNQALQEFVVRRKGPAVVLDIKDGDVVVPLHVSPTNIVPCDIGDGEKAYVIVTEAQIAGKQV